MSEYSSIKATINANIKANNNHEITGSVMNSVLNAMVNTLGAGYQFAGVATTATNPGTPDAKVFYIANGKGTYTNFGSLEVTEDEVVVLYWDTAWHKEATGIASQEKLTELKLNINLGTTPEGETITPADIQKVIPVGEYIYVLVDEENHIISAVTNEGNSVDFTNKIIKGNLEILGKFQNPDFESLDTYVKEHSEETSAVEWISITVDANGKIIEGIKADGTHWFSNIDSPMISELTKRVEESSSKCLDGNRLIGVIVWDAQACEQKDAPSTIQAEPTNKESWAWLSWKLFEEMKQDTVVVSKLPDIVNYRSWQRYLWDKTIDPKTGYGVKSAGDNSIYEMFRENPVLFEAIDDFILRTRYGIDTSKPYTRPERMTKQTPRKPLMAITKDMLGDDATVNDTIMNSENVIKDAEGNFAGIYMGGWGFSGYPIPVYKTPTQYDAQGLPIIDHVDMKYNERMVAQIDLAAHNGIDFWCFYIEFSNQTFHESYDSEYIHLKMKSNSMNNSLFQFLEAANNYKMKFCVMIGNTLNRKGYALNNEECYRMFKWINDKLFTHPCYLHVNGRPVVQMYESKENLLYDQFLHMGGSYIIYNDGVSSCVNIDGKFYYGSYSPATSIVGDYKDLAANNELIIDREYKNYSGVAMVPAALGVDDRPRYCYLTEEKGGTDSGAFVKPTKEEFYNHLKIVAETLNRSCQQDKIITIYAWDEFMEGGWLLPSQDEMENPLLGEYKLEAIKEFKTHWR